MATLTTFSKLRRLSRLFITSFFILWVVFSPIKTIVLYTGDASISRTYISRYIENNKPDDRAASDSTSNSNTRTSCSQEIAYLNTQEVRIYNRGCRAAAERLFRHCASAKVTALDTKCFIAYDKPIFGSSSSSVPDDGSSPQPEDDAMPIVSTLGGFISVYTEVLKGLLSGSCSKDGSCLQANLPLLFETVAANVSTEVEQVISLVQNVATHGDPDEIPASIADGTNVILTGDFIFALVSSSLCPGEICYSNGASSSFIKSAGAVSTLVSDIWSADQTDTWFCADERCDRSHMSVGVERNYIAGITMLNAKGFLEMHGCTEILNDLMELKYEVPDTLQRIPLEMALYLRCPALKTGIVSDLEHITAISSALRLKVEQHSAAGIGSLREVTASRTVLQAGLTTAKAADIVKGMYDGQNAGFISNTAWCNFVNGSVYFLDQEEEKLTEAVLGPIRRCLQRRWVDTYRRTTWVTRMAIEGSLTVQGPKANATIVFREPAMVEYIEKHLLSQPGGLPNGLSLTTVSTGKTSRLITRGLPIDGANLSNMTARILGAIFPNGSEMLSLPLLGPGVTISLNSSSYIPPPFYLQPKRMSYIDSTREHFDRTAPLIASCLGSPCQIGSPFFLPSNQSLIMFDSAGLSYRVIDDDVVRRLNDSVRNLSAVKDSLYAMEFYNRKCPHFPNWISMRGEGGLTGPNIELRLLPTGAILESRMGYREACFISSWTEIRIDYPEEMMGSDRPRLGEGCSFRIHRITFLDPVDCGNIMRGSDNSKRLNIFDSTEGESLIPLRSSLLETVETTSNGLQSYENGIIYIGILINAIYTVGLIKQIVSRVRIVSRVLSTFDRPTAKRIFLFYNGPLIEFVDYTERQMARCSLIEKIALCLPSMVTLARMIRPIARLDSGVIVAEQYILITRGAMAETTSSQWLIWLIAALSVGSVMTANPDMHGVAVRSRLRRWARATVSPLMLILSASGVCIIAEELFPYWLKSKVEIGLLAVCCCVGVAVMLQESLRGTYISVKTKDALSAGEVLDKLGRPVDLILPIAMIRPAPGEDENKVMLNVFWVLNHIMDGVVTSGSMLTMKRVVRPTVRASFSRFAIIIYRPGLLEVKMTDMPPAGGVCLGLLPSGTTVYFDSAQLVTEPKGEEVEREGEERGGGSAIRILNSANVLEGFLADRKGKKENVMKLKYK